MARAKKTDRAEARRRARAVAATNETAPSEGSEVGATEPGKVDRRRSRRRGSARRAPEHHWGVP